MPKRTLAPEALYHSEPGDSVLHHKGSPDYIPSMNNAAERIRRMGPDFDKRAKALLDEIRKQGDTK